MRILLDTHVLVWAESRPQRLGPATRGLLEEPLTELLVSPISTLELARLVSLSRLILHVELSDWLGGARKHLGWKDADFTHEIALESYRLPGVFHKDPADRILVASARELGVTLITADESILAYPHCLTRDARE